MIDLVKALPSNVVGFSAHGLVSEDDYREVLLPAVENALRLHDKIRVYYEIGRTSPASTSAPSLRMSGSVRDACSIGSGSRSSPTCPGSGIRRDFSAS